MILGISVVLDLDTVILPATRQGGVPILDRRVTICPDRQDICNLQIPPSSLHLRNSKLDGIFTVYISLMILL